MVSVGVVIPCHNQGDTLERAVLSALSADEVIIHDDASTDNTWDIGWAWVRREKRKIVFSHTQDIPAGVCYARNEGVRVTNTDLIIPLDADDYLLPGAIETFRDAYEPGVFVYSDYLTDVGYQTAPPPGMINRKNITHATICFSRHDFYRVGGYDVDFTLGVEDYALTCAFISAGLRPKHISVATYYRTENPSGRAARCTKYAPLLKQLLTDKYPQVFTG